MKSFIFFFLVYLVSSNVSSQDYPHSVGLAPFVDNYVPSSEIITDANQNSRSFLWNNSGVSSGTFNKHFLNNCALTVIGPTSFTPGGSVFANNTLYTVNTSSPYELYTVDTVTGAHTFVANVTNVPSGMSVTGMAWDAAASTMFAMVTSCAASQLAAINLTTGAMTLIGPPTAVAPCISALACSPAGLLFAVDISLSNLYRINKTTGAATLVGSMNVGIRTDIQFDMSDSLLYIITNNQLRQTTAAGGSGVLICNFSGLPVMAFAIKPGTLTGIDPIGTVIPYEYFIAQNYPNPFNPVTKIKFGLPENSNVKLSVYDILGREITILLNEFKYANTYEVDFDASNLPSGVYIYKLEAKPFDGGSSFTEIKRMVLIK